MQHHAAFYLCLHCLQNYSFRNFPEYKGLIYFFLILGLIAVCFIFFILTMVLEASKSLSFYLQAKLKQHPLTYGQTVSSIQSDRSPLFTAIMIPSNIGQIKRKRFVVAIRSVILPVCFTCVANLLLI